MRHRAEAAEVELRRTARRSFMALAMATIRIPFTMVMANILVCDISAVVVIIITTSLMVIIIVTSSSKVPGKHSAKHSGLGFRASGSSRVA